MIYTEFIECEEIKMLRKDFKIIEEFLGQLHVQNLAEAGWKKFTDSGP